jgi:hypothetical protein
MFKKFLKWGSIGFGIYILYKMMPFFVYGGLYQYVGAGIDRSIQSQTEYSNISMGPYRLRIPKSYLYYKNQLNGDVHHEIHMYALLPDISPRTHQNQEQIQFRFFPGGEQVITFSLEYFGNHKVKYGEELLHYLRSSNALDPNHPGETTEFGLIVYPPKVHEIFDEVFSYQYEDGDLFVLQCRRYGRGGKPPFNPSCKRHNVYIADGLYLNYEFERSHLKSWRDIDLALKNFIHSLILDKNYG